jgi:SAM-dependent methyltransferase
LLKKTNLLTMSPKNGSSPYPDSFFTSLEPGTEASASRVVPEVLKIISPTSVIDVGCGLGAWAREFQRHGISDIIGVDGEYVTRSKLVIAPESFLVRDLEQHLAIERKFDLAVCLEVAEHLPDHRGSGLITDLVALAPFVLFSAAIPGQDGTFHVNEQWPDYWQNIFIRHDYVALDCIRSVAWNDDQIAWWYRQNIILYAHAERVKNNPTLQRIAEDQPPTLMRLVHPVLYERVNQRVNQLVHSPSARDLLRSLPGAIVRAGRRRLSERRMSSN